MEETDLLFERREDELILRDPLFPYNRLVCCPLCGALVPTSHLAEHVQGDKTMLRIIRLTHPAWTRKECLEYYIRTYETGSPLRPGAG